jgi:hypothetical protein
MNKKYWGAPPVGSTSPSSLASPSTAPKKSTTNSKLNVSYCYSENATRGRGLYASHVFWLSAFFLVF